MTMTFLMRTPICLDARWQIISWMEFQTWLLLTERATNFSKADVRTAIAEDVIIPVHLNMHLICYLINARFRKKLLTSAFCCFFLISFKPYQRYTRPIQHEKKYKKYKVKRVYSSHILPTNKVFFIAKKSPFKL